MGEYFWAGLLAGLLIWVAAEIVCQLFRRGPGDRAGAAIWAVLPAEGPAEDLEYLLRRIRTQLSDKGFPDSRILVVDRGMDPAARQVALRFEGVRLCREKDMGPALVGMLPPQGKKAD